MLGRPDIDHRRLELHPVDDRARHRQLAAWWRILHAIVERAVVEDDLRAELSPFHMLAVMTPGLVSVSFR